MNWSKKVLTLQCLNESRLISIGVLLGATRATDEDLSEMISLDSRFEEGEVDCY